MDQASQHAQPHPAPKKRRRGNEAIEEAIGELNLVPYLDVMVNLIMFLLLTTAAVSNFGLITLDLQAFSKGNPTPPTAEDTGLNLTVAILNDGFTVAGRTGVLPGAGSSGPTIGKTGPTADEGYDFKALRDLLTRVGKEFPTEKRAILFAKPDTPYLVVVRTLDAMREGTDSSCQIVRRKPNKAEEAGLPENTCQPSKDN